MDLPIDQCANGVGRPIVEAIIAAESAGNAFAIQVNVRNGQPYPVLVPATTRKAAIAQARGLQAQGYSFDVGLMQVNSENLTRFEIRLEDAFDVCTNIDAGTRVYNAFAAGVSRYEQQFETPYQQMQATLSAYNTGSYWRGFKNGYVHRVMRHMGKPVSSAQHAVSAAAAPMEVRLSFGTDVVEAGNTLDEAYVEFRMSGPAGGGKLVNSRLLQDLGLD